MERPQFTAKEWNAGGAFQFYGKLERRTFVVEVLTTEDIQGELLQAAVDKALARMPYYAQTFVRQKGLYYYADDDLPFEVTESAEPRPLGGATTNYHMLDVTYSGPKIAFSMFHGLTDGLGLNRFIEATLYHYFCAKDGKEYSAEGIYTDAVPYDPAEVVDVFAIETKVDTAELKKLADSEERFCVPELADRGKQGPLMHRLPLRIEGESLLSWCKACGASPAAAISAFMTKAILAEHPTLAKGVVMNVLPFSLRRFLHADKTFKNCDAAIFLPVHPAEGRAMATGDLAKMVREHMKTQMSEEMALLLSSSINLVAHLGRKIPTFFLKNKIMALAEKKPQDTYFIDYVGGLTTPGYEDQIAEVRYLNPDHVRGSFFVLMSSTAGSFFVNFTHTFESDRYYEALCRVLDECGIGYERLPRDTYLNPTVELPPEQRRKK